MQTLKHLLQLIKNKLIKIDIEILLKKNNEKIK